MFIASTWKRLWAFSIDGMLINLLLSPLWLQGLVAYFQTGQIRISMGFAIAGLVVRFLYKFLFLSLVGATLGKLFFGLRVVSVHNKMQASWAQCFIRTLADDLSFFFSLAPQALALFSLERRHLSDWLAETQVVQKNERLHPPKPRRVLGVFFIVYFMLTGAASTVSYFKQIHLSEGFVVIDVDEKFK